MAHRLLHAMWVTRCRTVTPRPTSARNPTYVGDLYNTFLRRGGDLSGYQFWVGQVTTAKRNTGFARMYDLTDRVLPAHVVDTPTPDEAAQLDRDERRARIAAAKKARDEGRSR